MDRFQAAESDTFCAIFSYFLAGQLVEERVSLPPDYTQHDLQRLITDMPEGADMTFWPMEASLLLNRPVPDWVI